MSIARLVRRCSHPFALPLFLLATAAQPAAAQGTQEVRSLQQRLTDAKCYAGPLDGVMNPAVTEATKQCPDTAPTLAIETGMHVSLIRRIGVDRNCRMAVTGSDDKTVRLWSLPDGKLQRTLRVPIGGGDYGSVYAVAMSPDSKTVAAGGHDAYYQRRQTVGVYLFDASSGALTARLGDYQGVAIHLAFSPDGRSLAVALGDGQGIRVLDVKSGTEIAADKDYVGRSNGAAFAPDGRLFTTAFDGYLRSYDRNFKLVRKVKTTAGKEPFGVAVDEAGANVAVGFNDTTAVEVYRASDLGLAFAADTGGMAGGNLTSVAWSRNGARLIAGGKYGRSASYPVVVWEDGGRGKRSESEVAHNTVLDLAPCGEGFVAATYDPLWARLDANGRVVQSKAGMTVDMRGKRGDGLRVSRDGAQVRFGMEPGAGQPVLFDLGKATLTADAQGGALRAPMVDGIAVTDWDDGPTPKLAGTSLALLNYERSHSLAIVPNASGFLLGTDWNLRAFDRNGKPQWRRPAPGAAWGVNVTGDGRLAVAAYSDGTIRWHRLATARSCWRCSSSRTTRPGSPGRHRAITRPRPVARTCSAGTSTAAGTRPPISFRPRASATVSDRPDIVQQVLVTLDEAEGDRTGQRQANSRTDNSTAPSRLPPVVRIQSPPTGSR